jgi:hypothetical protein
VWSSFNLKPTGMKDSMRSKTHSIESIQACRCYKLYILSNG